MKHKDLLNRIEGLENGSNSDLLRATLAKYRATGEIPTRPYLRAWLKAWVDDIRAIHLLQGTEPPYPAIDDADAEAVSP